MENPLFSEEIYYELVDIEEKISNILVEGGGVNDPGVREELDAFNSLIGQWLDTMDTHFN